MVVLSCGVSWCLGAGVGDGSSTGVALWGTKGSDKGSKKVKGVDLNFFNGQK